MDAERSVEGLVTVRGGADGFVQEIAAGRHQLRSDEPQSAGGTDQGRDHNGRLSERAGGGLTRPPLTPSALVALRLISSIGAPPAMRSIARRSVRSVWPTRAAT